MSEDSTTSKTNPEDSQSTITEIDDRKSSENSENNKTSENRNFNAVNDKNETIEIEEIIRLAEQMSVEEHIQQPTYSAAFLKRGLIQGISYQLKLLTWTAWNLFKSKDNWELAAEVRDARGFHDLVVKYNMKTKAEESTSKYRFVQIKHTSSKHPIDKNHLSSTEAFDRQYSLVYLFGAYLDMLQSFKNDQIMDLTLLTNKSIRTLPFLVPIEDDTIFGFEKKGLRYRININAIDPNSRIMTCLKREGSDRDIKNFLSKLVLAVDQPTESELEELIINNMDRNIKCMPHKIFYTQLFKSVFDWFLTYHVSSKTSPYYTRDHIVECFTNNTSTLLNII